MRLVVILLLAAFACGCSSTRTERAAWVLTATDGETELEVQGLFGAASCTSNHRFQVTESSDTVTIEALHDRDVGGFCSAEAFVVDGSVTLEAPLAGRSLRGCDPDRPDQDCSRVRDGALAGD